MWYIIIRFPTYLNVKTIILFAYLNHHSFFQISGMRVYGIYYLNLQLNARANSTVRKYRASWLKWRSWATSKLAVPVIPAQAIHVALFVTELERTAQKRNLGFSSIEGVVYAISWYHKLAGLSESPTDHPVVKMAVEGAKRSLAKLIKPKEPLSLRLIQDIVCHYHSTDTLAVVRFLFIVLVGYAGFLRADELLNLQVSDITIFDAYMSIHVPGRKKINIAKGILCQLHDQGKLHARYPSQKNY